MATNAELSAKLLRSAAAFFRSIGQTNDTLNEQMLTNAETFERVAAMVETDPLGENPVSLDQSDEELDADNENN